MSDSKSTHLLPLHKECSAKIIDFGGWDMPVSYSGTIKEHEAVRSGCGLFDVSHMGEVFIRGEYSRDFCQWLLTNDVNRLSVGEGQYTAMLNEKAGFIDDLIVYRTQDDEYLLCVNASNTAKDVAWIKKKAFEYEHPVSVVDASDEFSQLALQGPESPKVIKDILSEESATRVAAMDFGQIVKVTALGRDAMIARTGYTGEKGYEIYCGHDLAKALWRHWIMSTDSAVTPCGLGARDTLRLESCYPLYGNEMNEEVNPYEIGIAWAVKAEAKDFLGRNELIKIGAEPRRRLVAFEMVDKGIARHGMPVIKGGQECGIVTSGSMLPTLGFAGGLALVSSESAVLNEDIQISVRGKLKLARIVKKPLYSPRIR